MRKSTAPRKLLDFFAVVILITLIGCIAIQVGDFLIARRVPEVTNFPDEVYTDTLTVVMDYDYEPYSFIDSNGNISGHDVELAYAIAEKLEVNLEIKLMQWSEARQAIADGSADIMMGVEYSPVELETFDLSIPLSEDGFIAFGKNKVSSLGELYGARFAVLQDSFCYQGVLQPYELSSDVIFYPNYQEAFKAVSEGKRDYVISRYSVGQRTRVSVGDKQIKPINVPLMSNRICIGMTKGDIELKENVDSAIVELIKDGRIDKLYSKWLDDYVKILNFKDYIFVNQNGLKVAILSLAVIIVTVFLYINRVLLKILKNQKKYITKELEHEKLFAEATKALYDKVYEVDITRNKAGNKKTDRYFKNITNRENPTYEQALDIVARKDVKSEFIQGYMETFSRRNIISAYKRGEETLTYDLLMSPDGVLYSWIRITAQIFFWQSDNSLRMIIYRKNIDDDKRKEFVLMDRVQRDPMTNLYNKTTTEELIASTTKEFDNNRQDALFVIDIDNFKNANDSFGHSFGDYIIEKFAIKLKEQFREGDTVGRIGGDEFAVYVKNIPSEEWLFIKTKELVNSLNFICQREISKYVVSASVGVVIAPDYGEDFQTLYKKADIALYETKKRGKNGYTIYSVDMEHRRQNK